MDQRKGSKLNRLLAQWPSGTVFACSWLNKQGYPYDLIHRYRKSGWVHSIGRGAIARAGNKVDWRGAFYAVQEQLKLKIHIGGRTVLEWAGRGHFLPLGKENVFLYGAKGEKLPLWFRHKKWNTKIQYFTTNLFPPDKELGFMQWDIGTYSLKISAPERAIMEMLYLVPQQQSYEESRLVMEGLATLRPKVVQNLLEECASIKVKRLFLHLTERSQHKWFNKLDVSKVKLGRGKRVIVKGGHLDPKYLVSVPTEAPEEKNA